MHTKKKKVFLPDGIKASSHCHHKKSKAEARLQFSETDNDLSPAGVKYFKILQRSALNSPLMTSPTASLFGLFRAKQGKK